MVPFRAYCAKDGYQIIEISQDSHKLILGYTIWDCQVVTAYDIGRRDQKNQKYAVFKSKIKIVFSILLTGVPFGKMRQ